MSALLALAAALPCAPARAAGVGEPMLLAVEVNGARGDAVQALRLADGGLAVAERDLLAWRLKPAPAAACLVIDGARYVRLAGLPQVEYRIDAATQTLVLQAPPAAFEATAIAVNGTRANRLAPPGAGGFLNYDLYRERDGNRDSAGGLFELGAFNGWGNGTTTGLWNDAGLQRRWVRLDSTWNVDMPERMQSLRLGDAIGRAGTWGRSVRFGGLQWGTNFATQPGFVTFPLPSLRGEAAVPSTLDVYLNNARVLQTDVPPGPFDLSNVPVVTGQGELQLVVHDLLGRQRVITAPYYASPGLLRPGLHDFSYEIGAVREDYTLASGRYGRAMASATDRLGIGDGFTRELRAEALADQQTVGAAGTWLLPHIGRLGPGTLSLGAAASHGPDGIGRLVTAALERQAHDMSFSLQARRADRDFVELGLWPGSTPRSSLGANLGFALGDGGFGFGWLRQSTWEGDDQRVLSASYSLRLAARVQLGLYALRTDSNSGRNTSVGAVLTITLDPRSTVTANLDTQDGRARETLQLQHGAPAGNGYGYRLLAGDDGHAIAGGTWQTDRADLSAEAAHYAGYDSYRAGISGGFAVARGAVFPSRRIDDSFAVVKVGDFPDVRVYRDNQEITRTDANGLALVSRLRAYEHNPVGIEQADLPLDAEVDEVVLALTPGLRSGVVADFPVRRSRGAVLRVVGPDGRALPPGTAVRIEGDAREFVVGYDGVVFVTGLAPSSRLLGAWNGQPCSVELRLPEETTDPQPDLGTRVCKGTTP